MADVGRGLQAIRKAAPVRTLLVFAKEPRPGRVKTRLAAAVGPQAACRVYQAFLSDLARVIVTLRETRVEWWVDGRKDPVRAVAGPADAFHPQPPGDLGTRLTVAFDAAFDRGGRPVAVVGTDCPLLGPAHLEALFAATQRGWDAALLPAEDGGYAGLALAEPMPQIFRGIPWSTKSVQEATLAALRRAGKTVRVLSPVYDVDTGQDLVRLAEDLRRRPDHAPETARVVAEVLGA